VRSRSSQQLTLLQPTVTDDSSHVLIFTEN
jgi:hypothetical protein